MREVCNHKWVVDLKLVVRRDTSIVFYLLNDTHTGVLPMPVKILPEKVSCRSCGIIGSEYLEGLDEMDRTS